MEKRNVELIETIDSAKFFPMPFGITVLTIFIMLVDGFDLQAIGQVAPKLQEDWNIPAGQLGIVITASMIGMALGSVALGWLGDRIGRKRAYVVCIGFLFVGSMLSAFATGRWEMFAYRLITGIGLGGVTPLAATMISEWTPKHARSMAVTCAIVAVPLGGMLGASVSQWILPAYGWRMMFFIGAGMPLVFVLIASFLLPESPKYLAQRPQLHGRLAQQLNRLFGEKRFDGTENFHMAEPPAPPSNWFLTLLNKQYWSTTLLLWAAFAFNTFLLYSYANYLPLLLRNEGLTLDASLQASKLFNFGGFFGAVGGAVLIGYLGSRIVGSGLALMGAIAAVLIGVTFVSASTDASVQLLTFVCFAGMAANGMQAFLYAVGAHSYPTYIRASGVGTAQTVSRIGGIISGLAGGAYLAMTPRPPVSFFFYVIAGAGIVVVISFFSLRTHIHGRKAGRAVRREPVTT
jgi:MFS transporter, AAHS family, 4-hydroxybenzoate transporter